MQIVLPVSSISANIVKAKFIVCLDAADGEDDWEVTIWHNGTAKQDWASLELSPQSKRHIMVLSILPDDVSGL